MLFTRLFIALGTWNMRFLPAGMFVFSLVKQAIHVLFEGRISVGTVRFTFAYLALCFDKQLTLDRFIMTFLGIGVIY